MEKCSMCGADLARVCHEDEEPEFWSELECVSCETRFGRWTNHVLTGDDREPRYGGKEMMPR